MNINIEQIKSELLNKGVTYVSSPALKEDMTKMGRWEYETDVDPIKYATKYFKILIGKPVEITSSGIGQLIVIKVV